MISKLSAMVLAAMLAVVLGAAPATQPIVQSSLQFINTSFENASPLQWSVADDGVIHIFLMYDYERNSPNRAAGHWYFQLQGKSGTDYTVVLHNFDNVWNGKAGSPVSGKTICYVSSDLTQWKVIPTEKLPDNTIRVQVHMDGEGLYLARLEPYRISDLERLLDEIRGHRLVQITTIGKTVAGRPLEIVRVGNPQAAHAVVLRARAHAWEPGGNWVVQGLIRNLLKEDELSRRCLERYCVYVMPMANKDGVAKGWTRFNQLGKDLNRNWDKPPDPVLVPENDALEKWMQGMVAQGRRPDLLMDLHNDEGGLLHVSRPAVTQERYLSRMRKLEELLRKHTFFTEGSTGANTRVEGSLGEGMVERFGIDGCILELNCNVIAGIKQPPTGKAWEQLGERFRQVFYDYFEGQ